MNTKTKKPIKYEHPPQVATEILALIVPERIWQEIGARFNLPLSSETFWDWVLANPRLPILITEGAKKARTLLSAGYCALALPGIYCGYRTDGKPCLIPQLEAFCQLGREFTFAFDSDKKFKAKQAVASAIALRGTKSIG